MGWKPGELLGKGNDRGLRVPLVGETLADIDLVEEIQKQIVDVLKLKIEQEQLESIGNKAVTSVFEEEEEIQGKQLDFRSEILVQVYNFEINALVDTGSDITCISGELWDTLREVQPSIPFMPIKPIQIKTAVGQRSVDIRNLALLPLKIGGFEKDTGFLIVPGLSWPIILGFDWMKLNEVKIILDKTDRGILICNNKEKQLKRFHVAEENQCPKENFEVGRGMDNITDGKTLEYKTGISLNKLEKGRLENLLRKFEGLFSSKLGRANCYEHEIKMEKHAPIVKKTYPISYAYRGKVEE